MNCVDMIGFLREGIDEFYRYFEYPIPFEGKDTVLPSKIVVRSWTDQANNRLVVLKENTRVSIHGHLEVDKKFGTILRVEQLEVIR